MIPLITGLYVSQQGSHGDALDLWGSVQFRIFQFLKDLGIPLSSMHSYLNKCHSPLWRSWELTTEYTYCCASWYSSKEIGPLVNRFWVWEQAPVWKLTSFFGSGCSQLPDYLDYLAQKGSDLMPIYFASRNISIVLWKSGFPGLFQPCFLL